MCSNLKLCVAAAVVCVASSTPIKADSIPLFVYQFPNSCSDLGPGGIIVNDLGAGNHDATPGWYSDMGLSTDVPAGMSGKSVDFLGASDMRVIFTADKRLLNTSDVAAQGGFVYDTWFKPTMDDLDGRRTKLIDYDGTEALELHNGRLLFRVSDSGASIYSAPLTADTWHHATAVFDTLGNPALDDPAHPGFMKVTGEIRLYLDNTLLNTVAAVKDGYGDSEDPVMSIGRYAPPHNLYNYSGLIYNPQVWLGTEVGTVPEPSTAILSAIGAGGLLCYAWRKRR
jgi:hypothetical protein